MIQRIGVNTRVQRQNTIKNKPQNFGMAFPREEVVKAIEEVNDHKLNAVIRNIAAGKYHETVSEAIEGTKYAATMLQKSIANNYEDGIIAWDSLSQAMNRMNAKLHISVN